MDNHPVTILYTNHDGYRGLRRIVPIRVHYGSNQWHKEPQWLLEAYDVVRQDYLTFALRDIHAWGIPPCPLT